MITRRLSDQYQIKKQKLLSYGFLQVQDCYHYEKSLTQKDLYAQFIVKKDTMEIRVYDKGNKEEYLPFYVKHPVGSYAAKVKDEVDQIAEDILKHCFETCKLREDLCHYAKQRYETGEECLFPKHPTYGTLKVKENGKWFVMFMTIPWRYLGVEREGEVNVMNLKNTPEKILQRIDHKTYFPAYHMHKRYWITIVLDTSIGFDEAKQWIDESYQLVAGKKKTKREDEEQ